MGLRDRIRAKVEGVKREVAVSIAENLRDQPDAIKELEEAGLLTREMIDRLGAGDGLSEAIRGFRGGLAELIREQPSAMAALEVRPLELLLKHDIEEGAALPNALTVLFSDLEGFTAFNAAKGDNEAAALLRDHYDAARAIVTDRRGSVIKTIGDGHMMSFHQPRDALLAGLDLIDAAPAPLRVRVGCHLGPVIEVEGDLLGNVVNLAARVTDLATGGRQVTTTTVRDELGDATGMAFGEPRWESVKGVAETIGVCEVSRA